MLTLYLSVAVSGPGGVEVEAERGGRGGFSSSPSKDCITGELTCSKGLQSLTIKNDGCEL